MVCFSSSHCKLRGDQQLIITASEYFQRKIQNFCPFAVSLSWLSHSQHGRLMFSWNIFPFLSWLGEVHSHCAPLFLRCLSEIWVLGAWELWFARQRDPVQSSHFYRLPGPSFLFFLILHQSLDGVARRAVQCNGLAAWRAHNLRAHRTLVGNTHLKNLMDGLPETVEVVIYQP